MPNKVSQLPPSESMTPEQALDSSKSLKATDLLVIGFDEGGEFFVRSSRMARHMAYWLTACAQDWMMRERSDDDDCAR